jgi:hypothetical protein
MILNIFKLNLLNFDLILKSPLLIIKEKIHIYPV